MTDENQPEINVWQGIPNRAVCARRDPGTSKMHQFAALTRAIFIRALMKPLTVE